MTRPSNNFYTSSDCHQSIGIGNCSVKLRDGDRVLVYPLVCSSRGFSASKQRLKHFGKYGTIEGYRFCHSQLKLKVRFDDGSLGYPNLCDIIPLHACN